MADGRGVLLTVAVLAVLSLAVRGARAELVIAPGSRVVFVQRDPAAHLPAYVPPRRGHVASAQHGAGCTGDCSPLTVITPPEQDAPLPVEPVPGPQRAAADGSPCRAFQRFVKIAGSVARVRGTACRRADGSWRVMPVEVR